MNKDDLTILQLINKNISMEEIARKLNITEKQLYIKIKKIINYGYRVDTKYSYDGSIYYQLNSSDDKRFEIRMDKEQNTFKCLVISDLHIGSIASNIKLVDIVYNYAIKNGIHIILNCGDFIEGDYTTTEKSILNIHDQLEYLIRKYPYDKSINNFFILGNHDNYLFKSNGLNIAKTIHNSRYDIIPIGIGSSNIKIKNDEMILFHQLHKDFKPIINQQKILLSGHSHLMKTKIRDIFWLSIPTLSYKSNDKTVDVIPGFVELTIDFENNKFEYVEAKHMIINPKVIQVSETRGKVKNLFNKK